MNTEPIACDWCGRAIYMIRNSHALWFAVKGAERDYTPWVCDASEDNRHAPPARDRQSIQ